MYLYDLFYFDSKSKLNEYSRKTNEYIFFISHIFSRFEYHICCTYYNWFVFEESHAKTLKKFEQNSFENQGVVQKMYLLS